MEKVPQEETLVCPYDKHHVILKSRMQTHLVRCRRNFPKAKKVTCPFNVTHVLDEPELNLHVRECPDRQSLENFINVPVPITSPTVPPPMQAIQCEDNWDDEPVAASYNPRKYSSNANILRSIQGAPPSERKEFRKQERLRLTGIKK